MECLSLQYKNNTLKRKVFFETFHRAEVTAAFQDSAPTPPSPRPVRSRDDPDRAAAGRFSSVPGIPRSDRARIGVHIPSGRIVIVLGVVWIGRV